MQNKTSKTTKSLSILKKDGFLKSLLSGMGYMVMGNLLAAIMSFSLRISPQGNIYIGVISVIFSLAIYFLLVAVPAYKDGIKESLRLKKDDNRKGNISLEVKSRWLKIGGILFFIMLIPSFLFLMSVVKQWWIYGAICGAVYPLFTLLAESRDGLFSLPFYVPFLTMGIYALTIPACHIGFTLGFNDSFGKGGIMYEKK